MRTIDRKYTTCGEERIDGYLHTSTLCGKIATRFYRANNSTECVAMCEKHFHFYESNKSGWSSIDPEEIMILKIMES